MRLILLTVGVVCALLWLGACGGDDDSGPITDVAECEEKLTDQLVKSFEEGEIPGATDEDPDDVAAAIERTLPEFCNEVELGTEGIEIEDIRVSAEAYVQREL